MFPIHLSLLSLPQAQGQGVTCSRPISQYLVRRRILALALLGLGIVIVTLLLVPGKGASQGKPSWDEMEVQGWDSVLEQGDVKFLNDSFWLAGSIDGRGAAVWTNQGEGWTLEAGFNSTGAEYGAAAFDSFQESGEDHFMALGSTTNLGVDIYLQKEGVWVYADGDDKDHDPENLSGTYGNPNRVLSIDTGDIDGDGNTDLVAGYLNAGIRVWLGDGKGYWHNQTSLWQATTDVDIDGDYYTVQLSYFNDDEYLDLVSCHKDNAEDLFLDVFLGDGEGNWVYELKIDTRNAVYSNILLEDLDDDEDLDFICSDSNKDGIDVLINMGSNSTWSGEEPLDDGKFSSIVSGDINFDGLVDILACYKSSPSNEDGIVIYYGKDWEKGEDESQNWERATPVNDEEHYMAAFLFPTYEVLTEGDPDSGEPHDLYIIAVNATDASRLIQGWRTSQPRVKNIDFSEHRLFPWSDFYKLNITLSGGTLGDGCESVDTLQVILGNDSGTLAEFVWHEDGEDSWLEMISGEELIYVLEEGITSNNEDSSCVIRFPFALSFQAPALTDGFAWASVKDDRGFESGLSSPGDEDNSFMIFPGLQLNDLDFSDHTLNPEAQINVTGNFLLRDTGLGEDIQFPYDNIEIITLLNEADGVVKAELNLTQDFGQVQLFNEAESFDFPYHFSEEKSGAYGYYVNILLSEWLNGEKIPQNFARHMSFRTQTQDIFMNYLVLDKVWAHDHSSFDRDSGVLWQRAGENIVVKADVRWSSLMKNGEWTSGQDTNRYEGEVLLRTPEGEMVTTSLELALSNSTNLTASYTVELVPNSAPMGPQNPFGSYLKAVGNTNITLGWDGEAPYLGELSLDSLRNGSSVKTKDERVTVMVHERLGFENEISDKLGTLTLHWEGNISGSVRMNFTNKTTHWEFWGDIPFSQAKEDDVVFFWITGNDSVGNPLGSRIPYPHPSLLFDGGDDSSKGVTFVDPKPPLVPTGLIAKSGDNMVELRWITNPDDDTRGYYVYKKKEGDSEYKLIVNRNQPVRYHYFKDEIVTNGIKYFYRISAIDHALIPNESNLSLEVSVTPEPEVDETPVEALQSFLTENLLMSFALGVGLVVVIIVAVVGLKHRGPKPPKEKKGKGQQPQTTSPESGFAPPVDDLSALTQPVSPFEQQPQTPPPGPAPFGLGNTVDPFSGPGAGAAGAGMSFPDLGRQPASQPQTRITQPKTNEPLDLGKLMKKKSPVEKTVPKDSETSSESKSSTCPHCNNIINTADTNFCIWCGKKVV